MKVFSAIYDKYKSSAIWFIVPLFFAILALYFCPTLVYENVNNGYAGLFLTFLYYIQDSHRVFAFSIVAIVFTIIAIICAIFARNKIQFLFGILPLCALGLYEIFSDILTIDNSVSSAISMSVYLAFDLLVILYITFLLFCALMSQVPPRQPKPHKPTKSERIAELERQVAELMEEKNNK